MLSLRKLLTRCDLVDCATHRHPRLCAKDAARNHDPRLAWASRMRRAAGEMSRATRHTRTPAPPQTYSAPPGAATRPSSSPIHRRLANRAPGMKARKDQIHHMSHDVVDDPVGTSLESRRVPLRAARGALNLNTDAPARRRLDIATNRASRASPTRARGSPPIATPLDSPRDAPARAKARDRAPAAPRAAPRAAAHGSWVAQCPAPFLSYTKFHVRLGVVCREGGRVRLSSAGSFLGGGCVRLSHRGHSVANPSFIYYICHRPHGHRPWASRDLIESRILELNPPYTKELRFR